MTSLKEIRTSQGVSQEGLAARIGVSRQTISKWESGDVRPSADNLMRLSQVFQLPVEAFLGSAWKPPEQQAEEAAVILPETPPEPDAAPATPAADVPPEPDPAPAAPTVDVPSEPDPAPSAEAPPEPDVAPGVLSVDVPQASVDEVPPPRRRHYRFWAALAAVLAVAGIIAGVISFSRRDVDAIPIEKLERREVNQFQIAVPGTLQPLQP